MYFWEGEISEIFLWVMVSSSQITIVVFGCSINFDMTLIMSGSCFSHHHLMETSVADLFSDPVS